jgi:hypothetical protein
MGRHELVLEDNHGMAIWVGYAATLSAPLTIIMKKPAHPTYNHPFRTCHPSMSRKKSS